MTFKNFFKSSLPLPALSKRSFICTLVIAVSDAIRGRATVSVWLILAYLGCSFFEFIQSIFQPFDLLRKFRKFHPQKLWIQRYLFQKRFRCGIIVTFFTVEVHSWNYVHLRMNVRHKFSNWFAVSGLIKENN